MDPHIPHVFQFDGFDLDTESNALYHRGNLVDGSGKKPLQVLAVLLCNANKLVSHQQLIDSVWGEDAFGVRPDHVNHYISKLRATLSDYEPENNHIESIKGRGYVFNGDVALVTDSRHLNPNEILVYSGSENRIDESTASPLPVDRSRNLARYFVIGGIVLIVIVAIGAWNWYRQNDEDEIRRVVKESQMFESLELYRKPSAYIEKDLDRYWATDVDVSVNYDRRRILDSVKKLTAEGRHYGDETKCEKFEFQSVTINASNDFADAKTLEKWFIAEYQADGTLLKNKTVGPYFVSYHLRMIGGQWLIEKSSTARANRPIPHVIEIDSVTEAIAGQQFLARIIGRDFEPELVYIEVIGPGCADSKPCKVPNSVLREHSNMSATELYNVPLTLASGSFRILVHNGESPASNPVYISVP